MAEEVTHAKPDGSGGIFTATMGQQLFVTSAEGIGNNNVSSILLRGKPFEDLGNIASLNNRPLVMITQDGDSDFNSQNHSEATPLRGRASETLVSFGMEQLQMRDTTGGVNGTEEVNMNNVTNVTAVPTSGFAMTPVLSQGLNGTAEAQNINNTAVPRNDTSLAFNQQQIMLNHQMFLKQQQTVNSLIGKVDGLAKMVGNEQQTTKVTKQNTRVKQLPRQRRVHTLSDSNISNVEDVSSESENSEFESDGYNSDVSECERNNDLTSTESAKQVTDNIGEVQVSDNMKLLQDLSKEFEKTEAVGEKVDETLSKVVDTGIRAQIDRNLAKELCGKYQRPENC